MIRRVNDTIGILIAFGIAALIGLLGIVVFSLQIGTEALKATSANTGSVVSLGLLIAGASLLIGALLGFLFGIPRTLQAEGAPEARRVDVNVTSNAGAGGGNGAASDVSSSVSYRVNTNLEQISDWLTKILVGVGLTQIGEIPTALGQLSAYFKLGLGNTDSAGIFGLALFLYYLVCGFLFGYLMTRIYLAGAFRQADTSALAARIEQVATTTQRTADELKEIKKQEQNNAQALILMNRQLNTPAGPTLTPQDELRQEELNAAVEQASSDIRAIIFNEAFTLRQEEWDKDVEKMERTIPIFRALVASDPESYNYRAQLGYALKDQRTPDWAQAEAELDQAIKLRGEPTDPGSLHYELNRAICRIAQDPAPGRGQPSDPALRKSVLDDLRAASVNTRIRDKIQGSPTSTVPVDQMIWNWLQHNQVALDTLT
jgi:hypothetical protein